MKKIYLSLIIATAVCFTACEENTCVNDMIGDYSATTVYSGQTIEYSLGVTRSGGDADVTFNFSGILLEAFVDNNCNILIENQDITFAGVPSVFSGSGSYSNDVISLTITDSVYGQSYTDVYTFNKN